MAGFSGGLPREPTHETEQCFRAENALKRCVANRPLQALFGAILPSNFGLTLHYHGVENGVTIKGTNTVTCQELQQTKCQSIVPTQAMMAPAEPIGHL